MLNILVRIGIPNVLEMALWIWASDKTRKALVSHYPDFEEGCSALG